MLDAAGEAFGAPLTKAVTVEDDGESRLRSVAIQRLGDKTFRLKAVVVGDSEHDVAAVDVIFVDWDGPPPIPTEVRLKQPVATGGKKVFTLDTTTFEDPAAAVDEVYTVVVDLKDALGKSLGFQEIEVTVDGGRVDEVAALTAELAAAYERIDVLEDFVADVFGSLDALDALDALAKDLQREVEASIGGVSEALKGIPPGFNVLLHELRGLAFEVTLD